MNRKPSTPDLAKALHCRAQNFGDCQFCEGCDIPKMPGTDPCDRTPKPLCKINVSYLMEGASIRLSDLSSENERLKAIVALCITPEQICAKCKHFAQCEKEAEEEEENDYHAQQESRFWACDGGQHFEPKEK